MLVKTVMRNRNGLIVSHPFNKNLPFATFAKNQNNNQPDRTRTRSNPLIDPMLTEALKQQERMKRKQGDDGEIQEPGRFQNIFGRRKKLSEDMPILDVKGQRINYETSADISQSQMERQLFEVERGPRMLPRKQRFRAMFGLFMIVGWFGSCYKLISYRLKSDDLELMEREVYEELKMKKDVERYI